MAIGLTSWGVQAFGQGIAEPRVARNAVDGLIAFNAGWQIPLSDRDPLLALEEKKIKEFQARQLAEKASPASEAPKVLKKNWSDKLQELWTRTKEFL